jgi:hypothetical protein
MHVRGLRLANRLPQVPGTARARTPAPQDPGSRWRISTAVGGAAFHLNAAGTQNLDVNPGAILHLVTINTGQSGATVTLYDGPDATHPEIAAIAATTQAALPYDIRLHAGLTAVVAGATPPDVTIVILPPPGYTT